MTIQLTGSGIQYNTSNISGTHTTAPGIVSSSLSSSLLYTLSNPAVYGSGLYEYFGTTFDASGKYVAVGSYNEDDANGTYSGKVHVYDFTTGVLLYTIDNPNAYSTSENDYFGRAVAVSSHYIVVGAYDEDDSGGAGSGKVYVFNVKTGQLLYTISNPNAYGTSAGDNFGTDVAITGTKLIVSAAQEDDSVGQNSGKVYIFNLNNGQLIRTLDDPNAYSTSTGDEFGSSLAARGNYVAVQATAEADAGGTFSGRVYVFNAHTGGLIHSLANPNAYSTSGADRFGNRIVLTDDYIIAGARQEDDPLGTTSGKIYVFSITSGLLVRTIDNPNFYSTSTNDYFGKAFDVAGNVLVVGVDDEDSGGQNGSGIVYLFDINTGTLITSIQNPSGSISTDGFGNYVKIVGGYLIIGASAENAIATDAGVVYVYNFGGGYDITNVDSITLTNGTTISQTNKLLDTAYSGGQLVTQISDPVRNYADQTFFGYSLALSGKYCAVGASYGINAGRVYVYDIVANRLLYTLDSNFTYGSGGGDAFGSVSIDGDYLAVGAPTDDSAGGFDAGTVHVYNIRTGTLLYSIADPNAVSTVGSDNFGFRVRVSGNYLAVCARQEDSQKGYVYIFDVRTGQQLWAIANPQSYTAESNEYFGSVMDLSRKYCVVGANSQGGLGQGKAYVFSPSTGSLLYILSNPNVYSTENYDRFGVAVAAGHDRIAVAAYSEDEVGGSDSGKVYIFNAVTGALVLTISNPNAYSTAANDYFGDGVAIYGQYLAVRSAESDFSGGASGKVYVFNLYTGALLYTLSNPNAYGTSTSDVFGQPIAISDRYLVASALQEDNSTGNAIGAAYLFSLADQTYLDKIYTAVAA